MQLRERSFFENGIAGKPQKDPKELETRKKEKQTQPRRERTEKRKIAKEKSEGAQRAESNACSGKRERRDAM